MADDLSSRPVSSRDSAFLLALFSSARKKELDSLDWDTNSRQAFLEMQFQAQQSHYETHFPLRDHRIVLLNSHPIGMTDIARKNDEIRVLDIILQPENRNSGLGTQLMQNLLGEADQSRRPIRLYVEKFNPALNLYKRLDFSIIEDTGVHYHMERFSVSP